ncbi:MAG: DEAD/DEAH box helicase family protein [Gallionella sp.]|nr:DEAD/DEAH box helicase family protein [Gallionella sp.]PIR09792.1 MAG: type III restriction endonuclease subunit R [Gallionellaceae bacterium CG11_big_fil_rev_8_21_14_0_20_60_62]
MNRHVNAIAGRLSLRAPQRRSLEILDRITEIVPPCIGTDIEAALEIIRSEFPSVTDFEREFPSLCFALATGVGKTRLMGAFISYLHLAHGIKNFFVLAPNLTIYNKLIADFSDRTHHKYVFKGISEFAIDAPVIITGDNYDQHDPASGTLFGGVRINIFNISKINSEVRGGRAPRIKRLSEYIGESYFDYLAGLPDLVLLMDESHRYRASAGIRALNELKPILGLELTATPFVEGAHGTAVQFKNVILDYPLGRAMEDGFVKEPAVVTRKNFNPAGMSPEEIERMKLEDGVRLHESVKVELETYARETDNKIVKPFVLVIARDTTHAGALLALIQSDGFFEGRYKDKVIQVDSSQSGAKEEEMIARLLKVEHTDEPTEIVIHVNMLKEGWDVTNLYTIVPLRAANARILIEQSIGRGLRLPYGKRTGVTAVDRLNIVAHDKFQEIIDEANRPDSAIHLKAVVLDNDDFGLKTATIVSQTQLATQLGIKPADTTGSTKVAGQEVQPVFTKPEEQKVAQIAYEVIRKMENQPTFVPTLAHLSKPEVQAAIVKAVQELHRPAQLELEGVTGQPNFSAVVAKTIELVQQTIDIPRILVVPKGAVKAGFKPFTLKLDTLKYPAVSEELWVQILRTNERELVTLGQGGIEESRMEDYVVSGLADFDDVSYDDQTDLLYDLAAQTVKHFCSYLTEDEAHKVLRCYQRDIARFIHAQMQEHSWEDVVDYEVVVSKGYTEFKSSAYTYSVNEPPADYRVSPADKSNMSKYVFGGFKRCLYPVQKFDSEAERVLAVILDRDAEKWFKPAKGQFLIFYKQGAATLEYQPDFVAETKEAVYMLEPKASNQMEDEIVLAKKEAALKWCKNASDYAGANGGKVWRYVLIPHTAIAVNITVKGLAGQYEC